MLKLLEYLVARFFLTALQTMPYGFSIRVARSLARLAYRFDSTPRRRTRAHLRLAYGDALGEDRIDAMARGVFESLVRHAAEAAQISRRSAGRMRFENEHLLREAYAQGRGVVVVSAHLGCFIHMVLIPRLLGVRAAVIMKNQRNDRLLQWGIRDLKRRFDLDVILKKRATDQIGPMLKAGGVVALFADQHPRNGGHPARFFGREVLAPTGPTIYAKRFECPLLVLTAALDAKGTHVLRFEGPVPTDGSPEELSQRWTSLLEERIRAHPEQWMWMHRRWRDEAEAAPGTA